MYPRWATTKTYSKPLYDLTGKRPVRSADDQSALVMVLARDHSVRGGEEALLIADRQVEGGTFRVEAMPFRKVSRWRRLWRGIGVGTCEQVWGLVGESRKYMHGRGRGGKWR
jgi:hypothetical protein